MFRDSREGTRLMKIYDEWLCEIAAPEKLGVFCPTGVAYICVMEVFLLLNKLQKLFCFVCINLSAAEVKFNCMSKLTIEFYEGETKLNETCLISSVLFRSWLIWVNPSSSERHSSVLSVIKLVNLFCQLNCDGHTYYPSRTVGFGSWHSWTENNYHTVELLLVGQWLPLSSCWQKIYDNGSWKATSGWE